MKQTSYQQLAKEFIGLWQKQIAATISDKEFIQAMLDMVESMKMPNATKNTTAAFADESGDDSSDHAQLAYRLAMCERRIAALEKRYGGKRSGGKTAAKKTIRSNSRRNKAKN